MIPRIIHQTWRDQAIPPRFQAYVASWSRHHPGWETRLWTDADLDRLVAERLPQFLDLYRSYAYPIMRADFGRYAVLKCFGGIYADLDAEAHAPFDSLLDTDIPVLAWEPPSHSESLLVHARGFQRLVSNAVMLSPAQHPFWDTVLDLAAKCRSATGPLDATGPMLLTAAVDAVPPDQRPRMMPAHVFTDIDHNGQPVASDDGSQSLSTHHWAGTWFERGRPPSLWRKLKTRVRRFVAEFSHGASGPDRAMLDRVDPTVLGRLAPADGSILIAVPVRNAATTLDRLLIAILALAAQHARISIAFLIGDTTDDSAERIARFRTQHGERFQRFTVATQDFGAPTYRKRWKPRYQRERRARIARVRNLLLDRALATEDWVLWIDADVVAFEADIAHRMLAVGARIVHPNCVVVPGGRSFDLNAWVIDQKPSEDRYYKYIIGGLYQPPSGDGRVLLSDLRYHDRVALDSVGGTMLLVDANLHRAGIRFPETPYNRLIETEGMAALARDVGVVPIGLPNVELVHES